MTYAATISRQLRAAGITILPSGTPLGRQGIRVEATGTWLGLAMVTIADPAPSARRILREAVTSALANAGYTVEANRYNADILYVKAAPEPPLTIDPTEHASAIHPDAIVIHPHELRPGHQVFDAIGTRYTVTSARVLADGRVSYQVGGRDFREYIEADRERLLIVP